jgi:uncharacterized protein YabN with tetrapyrrole methylase and pyrophosphatase domain
VLEEIGEVESAGSQEEIAAEIGDLLFAVVNYARWLKVDPEASLREANGRFRHRFGELEAAAQAEGRGLEQMGPEELDRLWEAAKREPGAP